MVVVRILPYSLSSVLLVSRFFLWCIFFVSLVFGVVILSSFLVIFTVVCWLLFHFHHRNGVFIIMCIFMVLFIVPRRSMVFTATHEAASSLGPVSSKMVQLLKNFASFLLSLVSDGECEGSYSDIAKYGFLYVLTRQLHTPVSIKSSKSWICLPMFATIPYSMSTLVITWSAIST